jgi:hypothetical protein
MTDTTLARALDLTRAVTDILSKGGALGGLVGHAMKWLAREGIPERDFAYCLEKSKALLYPNDNGLKIRSRLRESDAKLKANPYVAGLRLVSALSIGRWMADDPDYCYLVTTVAALFTQHDMPYASEAVCDMLLDEGSHEEASRKFHRYERDRLLPVVKKIIESIILNVVNCSGNFDKIPAELLGICSHHTDSHTFAAAAMAISRSSGDVIIRCNRFLADLYVWLLAHIEGEISISIAGKIHRATSGRPLRNVTMLADETCSSETSPIASTLVLSVNVGGTLRTLLQHTDGEADGCRSLANARQSLYDLETFHRAGRPRAIFTHLELRQIRAAARCIIEWLMTRTAEAYDDSRIVYRSMNSPDSGLPTVGSLMSRWPAICNEKSGQETSKHNFEAPSTLDTLRGQGSEKMPLRDIFNCFPYAQTIIEHACRRCRCTSCRDEMSRSGKDHGNVSKPGCLAYLVEDHLCLIIAHAVADGFGIPDASNVRDFSKIRRGVQNLMSELISSERIMWKTWFSLAACIYLNCECHGITAEADKGFADLVAIQHGSQVVVAPWVDLRSDLASEGSFGCFIANGQLSGMEVDFGLLYTEDTSPPAGIGSDGKPPESQSMTAGVSEISLQSAINGPGPSFRLTTIAKAGNYLRIINPAAVMMAFGRVFTPKCKDLFHGAPAQNHQMWSVEDALGLWGQTNSLHWIIVDTTTCSIANRSDPVRLNLLMAFSPYGCVLKQEDCCLTCAIAQARNHILAFYCKRILCVAGTDVPTGRYNMQTQNPV